MAKFGLVRNSGWEAEDVSSDSGNSQDLRYFFAQFLTELGKFLIGHQAVSAESSLLEHGIRPTLVIEQEGQLLITLVNQFVDLKVSLVTRRLTIARNSLDFRQDTVAISLERRLMHAAKHLPSEIVLFLESWRI